MKAYTFDIHNELRRSDKQISVLDPPGKEGPINVVGREAAYSPVLDSMSDLFNLFPRTISATEPHVFHLMLVYLY